MAEFSYKGRSGDGKLVNGRVAGDSIDQVAQRLIATGVIPIEIASIETERLVRMVNNILDLDK